MIRLKEKDGKWLEKEEDITNAFSNFYNELFASNGIIDRGDVLKFIEKQVTWADNLLLERTVTAEKIREAAFQLWC